MSNTDNIDPAAPETGDGADVLVRTRQKALRRQATALTAQIADAEALVASLRAQEKANALELTKVSQAVQEALEAEVAARAAAYEVTRARKIEIARQHAAERRQRILAARQEAAGNQRRP